MIVLSVSGESATQYTRSPRKLDDTTFFFYPQGEKRIFNGFLYFVGYFRPQGENNLQKK